MKYYEFTLVVESPKSVSEQMEDALFEAGCDDALLSFRNGIAYIEFDRRAKDLEEAVISAIQQVENAGLDMRVKRVEPSDLVTSAEIARRLKRSRQSIQQLISGSRGIGDFPLPVAGVTSKTMLWSWQEVAGWFLQKQKINDKTMYEDAKTLKQLNESLDVRHNKNQLKNIQRITKLLKSAKAEMV